MSTHDHFPDNTPLDQLLASADADVLQMLHNRLDLQAGQATVTRPPNNTPTTVTPGRPPTDHSPDGEHAATIITMRVLARDLARDLARTLPLDRARDLAHALDRTRDLDHDLARALPRARDLVRDLDRTLAHARDLALTRTRTRARDRDLARDRARTHDRALALALALDAVPVDVSGADLSHLDLPDLDVLAGVVWTRDTIWPPDIAAQVDSRSEEIRPGVYQVRGGSERDPLDLITM